MFIYVHISESNITFEYLGTLFISSSSVLLVYLHTYRALSTLRTMNITSNSCLFKFSFGCSICSCPVIFFWSCPFLILSCLALSCWALSYSFLSFPSLFRHFDIPLCSVLLSPVFTWQIYTPSCPVLLWPCPSCYWLKHHLGPAFFCYVLLVFLCPRLTHFVECVLLWSLCSILYTVYVPHSLQK
jgi:hypothetical protein